MSQSTFETACAVVIAVTLLAMARTRGAKALLVDYVVLAAAGWVGEQSCIQWYRFYAYAPQWSIFVGSVPLLVPLIWPLVILSARDIVSSLWPSAGRLAPLIVGAVVAFDASLVEVVAVRAGLWGWAEPGYLGVPVIGILGWGYFAIGASAALDQKTPWKHALVMVLGPLTAHALILATWWGLFRWTLRGDLGNASLAAMAVLGAGASLAVRSSRRAGHLVPMSVAGPRSSAALLFLVLFALHAMSDLRVWIHLVAVSVPQVLSWASLPGQRVRQGAR